MMMRLPNRKWNLLIILIGFMIPVTLRAQSQATRIVQTINTHWRFKREDISHGEAPGLDDQTWQVIDLPHTWNAKDAFDDTPGYYRGPAWYRKNMHIPAEMKNDRLFLRFGAANIVADLYVNGHHVLHHNGGFTAFAVDITPYVNFNSDNLIAVRVDNSYNDNVPPLSADFTFFGGIYRDAELIAVNPVHIAVADLASAGVFIHCSDITSQSAKIHAATRVINQTDDEQQIQVRTDILDNNDRPVTQMKSVVSLKPGDARTVTQTSHSLSSPHLWSPQTPYLYRAVTTVLMHGKPVDSESNSFGIRWYRFDPNHGFFLNGKHVALRGVNRHQFYPGLGNAVPPSFQIHDMQMIKDMGANFVRLAHYPQDQSVLDAADRLGLLIWQEAPDVNYIDTTRAFRNNATHMLREMIRQYYNHPSIILWGYMNEILLVRPPYAGPDFDMPKYDAKVVSLASHLNKIAHQEDPYRRTVMAMHESSAYDKSGLSSVPDVVGWNLYPGWYGPMTDSTGTNLFGKFLDEQHDRYPNRKIIVSEYGAGSDNRIHTTDPHRFDFSIEYQNHYHQEILDQIDKRDWLAGSAAWVMFDFASEGRNDTRPWINEKGLVNQNRTPKEVYYLYKARLTSQPFIHIADRDWDRRTVDTVSHNPPYKQPVTVFSNLNEITLHINGQSIGTKPSGREGVTYWSVPMHMGTDIITATGSRNGRAYSDRLPIHLSPRADFSFTNNRLPQLHINVGASFQYDAGDGTIWVPDQSVAGNDWGYNNGKAGHTSANILMTDNDPLYQYYREDVNSYHFPVPDGTYDFTIYLAEPKVTEPGKRIFSATVNGIPIFTRLDLVARYGFRIPVTRSLTVSASKGSGLTLTLKAIKGTTLINGIAIRRLN